MVKSHIGVGFVFLGVCVLLGFVLAVATMSSEGEAERPETEATAGLRDAPIGETVAREEAETHTVEAVQRALSTDTPLQLMMTNSDRTQLANGNEFLNISGRIINPTDRQQKVPPIHAKLHDTAGKVVYSWTIPPPAKSIPPGGSTSFNSAELDIPQDAAELTVTLGSSEQ